MYHAITEHNYNDVVPHIFVVKLDAEVDRRLLIQFLTDLKIPVGVHYKPNHLHSFFACDTSTSLPSTDDIYPRLLTLPLHPEISLNDVDFIVKSLKEGIKHVKTASR